jgi:hypothetical protein
MDYDKLLNDLKYTHLKYVKSESVSEKDECHKQFNEQLENFRKELHSNKTTYNNSLEKRVETLEKTLNYTKNDKYIKLKQKVDRFDELKKNMKRFFIQDAKTNHWYIKIKDDASLNFCKLAIESGFPSKDSAELFIRQYLIDEDLKEIQYLQVQELPNGKTCFIRKN